MLIDWFTVIAQAVNFLILVWLMKRFLYQPILSAIDARERRIAAQLADADAKEAEARSERQAFQRKNDEFDKQHLALLSQAKDEAAAQRQRLFDAARKDADDLRDKQQTLLRNEFRNLHAEIARRTRTEAFAIARQLLTDLAGESLEARMADVFVQRLRELDAEEKNRLASLLPSSSLPVLVRSAFELPPAQRALIEAALGETFAALPPVRFERAPDLIGGIELILQGQKIAWSLADSLAALEKGVNELLKSDQKTAGHDPKRP